MKKGLWMTLAAVFLLGTSSITAQAEEKTSASTDQQAVIVADQADNTLDSNTNGSTESSDGSTDKTEENQQTTDTQENPENNNQNQGVATVTSQQVDEAKKGVVDEVKKQVNDGDKEVLNETDLSDADSIRKTLLSHTEDYGITEKQINAYSDQQLTDAATLFKRYNNDLSGMDLGAFVSLLNALYQDKTLSVTDCLAQLSFDPESYSSYSGLLDNLSGLQAYLAAFYPAKSSFFPINSLSDAELTTILKNIQIYADRAQADGQSLEGGKIAWISYAINHPDFVAAEATKDSTTEKAKNEKEPVKSSTTSTEKSEAKTDKKGESLPQTGEQRGWITGIIGVIVILAVAGFYFWNRSRKAK